MSTHSYGCYFGNLPGQDHVADICRITPTHQISYVTKHLVTGRPDVRGRVWACEQHVDVVAAAWSPIVEPMAQELTP